MKDYLLKPFAAPGETHEDSSDAVPRGTIEPAGAIRLGPVDRAAVAPTATDTLLIEAQGHANTCERFLQIRATGYSLRQAAAAVGKSVSYFSGDDSMLARYLRGGIAALLPAPRVSSANVVLEVPDWFVPAAQFFYLAANHARYHGSVPEAVRRTISLPAVPTGWPHGLTQRLAAKLAPFLSSEVESREVVGTPKALLPNPYSLPTCPPALREQILAREAAGQPLVTARLARQIAVNRSIVQLHRSPRAWALDNLSAPGSQRRYFNRQTNQREIMQPGDWFGGDDATPGIAVCVPCTEVATPCAQKFGVIIGRFQWLAFHDGRTDKILAWDYVIRPRGSYRAEDIVNGMGAVVRTHGVPRQGFQFEGGAWNSKLVRQAIELLGCQHWRTYSPHQKAIESVFNRVWTRLAVQFPHADMGRYRNENESNCALYEACKKGQKDPRRYFPTLDLILAVFTEEVAAHNGKLVVSEQYGRWVPDDFFSQAVAQNPLRPFNEDMGWFFSPFSVERKVRGMMARCRVPIFEDLSVPFEFCADWLPLHSGRLVRLHFNPREPKCSAMVVLLEAHGQFKAGQILGRAQLIGETAGHIRLVMGWADDNQRAGYIARQRTAQYLRRETRGIGHGGRTEYAKSEQRDGLGRVATLERAPHASAVESSEVVNRPSAQRETQMADVPARTTTPAETISVPDRAARRRELEELRRQNKHLFM